MEFDSSVYFRFNTYFNYLKSLFTCVVYEYLLQPSNGYYDSELDTLYRTLLNISETIRSNITNDRRLQNLYKRGKEARINRLYEDSTFRNQIFNAWTTECELIDPDNEKARFFFDTTVRVNNNRRLYSNWKPALLYYSPSRLTNAAIFLLTKHFPHTHRNSLKQFENLLYRPFKDIFFVFPFNLAYGTNGFITDTIRFKKMREFQATVKTEPFYERFVNHCTAFDAEVQLERWLRNVYEDTYKSNFREVKKAAKRARKRGETVRIPRAYSDISSPENHTILHAFYNFRLWSHYFQVEPFLHGARLPFKKMVWDLSFIYCLTAFNIILEWIIFRMIREHFVEMLSDFVDLIRTNFEFEPYSLIVRQDIFLQCL
ncbi:hypothetical protein DRQ15_01465 [candidate division KSB1 bacterium]|nr:MAG: hypothetical protein DRQ15_01465 [candidate division KSB1 bacterium]